MTQQIDPPAGGEQPGQDPNVQPPETTQPPAADPSQGGGQPGEGGEESQGGQGAGTAPGEGGGEGAPQSPGTVEVLGKKYDLSQPDQVQELIKDYDLLGRQYTPLTQRLAEYERQYGGEGQGRGPQPSAPGVEDPETVEYLRRLGFVPKQDMLQEMQGMQKQREEDQALEQSLQHLETIYDGKDGRPKFDRPAVLQFCISRGVSNPEDGYRIMNWDALREYELRQAKQPPQAPPSAGGEGGPREPQPKKRVFGSPEGGDQVSLRDAMEETLEGSRPNPAA